MRETYLPGVPCWVDVLQPDVDATMAFYGALFGWSFEQRTPPGAPQRYCYATLEGQTVGGVGGPPVNEADRRGWTSYVCVESAQDSARRAVTAGGSVLVEPVDVGPPGHTTGRSSVVADPAGAVIGMWEPATLRGAQLVNLPGSWNFSDLQHTDPARVEQFYAAVFGWELDVLEMGAGQKAGMWRRPGYGDFLAADDPELRERQAQAPNGFADAVAIVGFADAAAYEGGGPTWGVVFSVADVDASLAKTVELGATARGGIAETQYTRAVTVRDPQGALVTLSQYVGPT